MIFDIIIVSRLILCEDLEYVFCGDVLFYGYFNLLGQYMYYRSKIVG